MALTDKLTAIANGFRTSRGTQDKYTLDQMAVLAAEKVGADPVINPLSITANGTYTASDCDGYSPITVAVPQEGAPTAEELTITDNCTYKFAYSGWDWVINKYGNRITSKDVTNTTYMFYESNIDIIPFDINCKDDYVCPMSYMFAHAKNLETVPYVSKCKMKSDNNLFNDCQRLREVPETFGNDFDWSVMDGNQSTYPDSRANIFTNCYSLRSFPMEYLAHGGPNCTSATYSIYYYLFHNCYALDEIIGLPLPHKNATWTSNYFHGTFNKCYRLKNMTFALDPETTAPYVVNWKNQTIDLISAGYTQFGEPFNYNSGLPKEKWVTDAETYELYKNDDDWTGSPAYSRYNHDSAVATINSLPDTSAYLATAGGTNIIKFYSEAGSATDGGAINTLTEEEIAVATAKGWTVTIS